MNNILKDAPRSQLSILEKKFNTFDEMLDYAYGDVGAYLRKDSEIDMDTTGARNVIYGAKLNWEVCVLSNALGALPDKPWGSSGFRIITAAGSTSTAALAENAAPPATLQPTVVEVSIPPELFSNGWEMSAQMLALQGKDDNATWAEYANYEAAEFKNRLDRDLLTDANTTAANRLESLDCIIASNGEVSYVDAGDLDPWAAGGGSGTIDRDGGTTYDAYVSLAASDRSLSLSLVDGLFTNTRYYWDDYSSTKNKVIITGYDTGERLEQLLQSQQRFDGYKAVQFGVNGVQTVGGQEAGFDVSAYKGVPVILDNNVVQDTISRLMLVDMDHMWISMLSPVQYFETPDFTGHDKFTKQGYFWMMGNTWANRFHCHAKLRDLK